MKKHVCFPKTMLQSKKKKKGKKEMNFPTKKCNSYTCMLTLEPNLSPSRPHHPAGEILQEGCRQKPL